MLVPMTKIHMIGDRGRVDLVLARLQELRVVHLIDVTLDSSVRLPALAADEHHLAELQELRFLRARIDSLLALVPNPPSPRPVSAGFEHLDLDEIRIDLEADGSEIERLVHQLDGLSAEQESLPRHIDSLARLLPLLPDVATTHGYETTALLIDRRFASVLSDLNAELRELIGRNFEIISDRVDPDTVGAVLVFPRSRSQEVLGLLGREQVSRVRLPSQFEGMSFREAISAMDRRLAEIPALLEAKRFAIDALVCQHENWATASRQITERLGQLAAVRLVGASPSVFVICGWVPTRRLDEVKRALVEVEGGSVVLVETAPGESDTPPVLLDNPTPAQPFEMFVKLLSIPAYGGLDPTLLMMAFMPLFVGMMLGDIAYGTVLLVLAMMVNRRHAMRPGVVRDLSRVLSLSAGWSIVWGVIYGEFLGDLGHRLFGLEPIWINREEALKPMLIFSLGVGAAHVTLGLLLGIWGAARAANRTQLAERTALLVALMGMFLIVGTAADRLPAGFITPGVAAVIVGLAVMMASGGAIGILMGPLELLGTVGNVLSYLRIAAIGLASVFLARVANDLGAAAPLWLGILIATLFHTLNLALGAFSPTIQALRLHYVEFFSKFYEEGGEEYQPFGGTTDHHQLEGAGIG